MYNSGNIGKGTYRAREKIFWFSETAYFVCCTFDKLTRIWNCIFCPITLTLQIIWAMSHPLYPLVATPCERRIVKQIPEVESYPWSDRQTTLYQAGQVWQIDQSSGKQNYFRFLKNVRGCSGSQT